MWRVAIFSLLFFLSSQMVYAHGTQAAYCITNSGTIRVYIEHWHGNIVPSQVVNALVVINVTDVNTNVSSQFMMIPDGVVWNTSVNNLPDCKGPLTILHECSGVANTYNDWVYWDFVPPSCFDPLTIELAGVVGSQSWYFDEACGALYPTSFTDSFIDCAAPSITCPSDMTINANANCEANVNGLDPAVLFDDCTDTDDIDLTYTITGATVGSGNGVATGIFQKGVSVVTYTATDLPTPNAAAKSSTCSFTVTIEDATGPILNCPADLTFGCNYNLNNLPVATATDNCATPTISFTDNFSGLSECNGTGNILRTWSAEDECGNTTTCIQTFVIEDMDPPTIVCPPSATVSMNASCNFNAAPAITGTPTGADDCGSVQFTFTDDNSGLNGCGGTGNVIRTWRAEDDCGNFVTCTQTITVDVGPPTIVCPADETVSCVTDINVGNPTITTECGQNGAITTVGPTFVSGTQCGGLVYEIEYTVTDDCGATAQCVQTFNVEVGPPTISCPADQVVNCFTDISVGTPTTSTDCMIGSVVTTAGPTLASGTDMCNGSTYEITYTVTDDCGGMAECVQTFTLSIAPPTIVCPPDATVSCFSDISVGTPLTTTECGFSSSVASVGPILATGTDMCDESTYTMTYTVTDECGVSASCVQTFTLDVGAPTIVCPADETVACFDDIAAGTPTITTECALGNTFAASAPTLASGTALCDAATYEITYTVTDECGMSASCVQTFTLDVGPPTIVCPADATVTCLADIAAGTPTMNTECGQGSTFATAGPTLASGTAGCSGATYEIVYTVTDDCGSTAQCVQTFTLSFPGPTIGCPSDATVACFSDVVAGTPAFTTQCELGAVLSNVGPTLTSGVDLCDGATYEIIHTVTDDCGSTAQCVQTFTLDVAAPVITCPADETVSCVTEIMAGTPTTTTGCALGSSTTSSAPVLVSGPANCNGAVYEVTHTVSDDCGVNVQCVQSFTISMSPPTIVCPPDETVSCFAEVTAGVPTTTTQCDLTSIVATSGSLVSGTAECDGAVYSILYIVTDECGQFATCSQTFTLDVDGPTIVCPADETVSCFSDISVGVPLTTTECGLSSSVASVGPILATGTDMCDESTYTITYTVTDECGVSASCVQTFTLDVGAPTIVCPADETVACFDEVVAGTAVTTTECGLGSTSTSSSPVLTSGIDMCDGATYEITYTITDDCGVSASCVQTFTLDVMAPVIVCPADETVSCFGDIVAGTPTTSTGCSFGSNITTSSPMLVSGTDLCDGAVYEISFTVSDDCGASVNCVQSFTLDVGPPTIVCPADATVLCFSDIAEGTAVTTTECGLGSAVTTVGPNLVSGTAGCDAATYEITYTVTDDCGVSASCVQTFTLDVGAPTIVCPADETVTCFSDIIAGTPVTTTECGAGSLVSTVGPTLTSGVSMCNGSTYEITYTVTDDCGQIAQCVQAFTLNVAPPVIICPADETVSCFTDIMVGTPTTTTGCSLGSSTSATGPVLVSGVDNCDNAIYEITYTVSDDCGVNVQCVQSFTLNVAAPTIVCPADETVSCFSEVTAGVPTTTTQCDLTSIVATSGSLISGTDQCDGAVYEILYIITDQCGQFATCTQTFTLDILAPTIVCPADETISCFDDIVIGTPITSTSCGFGENVTTEGPTLVSGTDLCGGSVYEITYTVTDDCGATAVCVQSITLAPGPPTIVCPADATVSCFADIAEGTPVTTTECGLGSMVTTNGPTLATGTDECDGATYEITYTITDECGVSASCVQTFTLNVGPPTIVCPADETVSCLADIASGIPVTTTECGLGSTFATAGPTLTSGIDECTNATYEIVYTVTDVCGSTAQCVQTFTLNVASPTIVCPADQTLSCFSDIVAGTPVTTVSCSGGSLVSTVGPTLTSGVSMCDESTYEIIYTVTDDCGSTAQCVQTFTLDVAPPVIICPADETVSCFTDITIGTPTTATGCTLGSSTSASAPVLVSGVDNCDNAVYEVTYTVTDDCGVNEQCVQTFTLNVAPPTIVCPPDETVACFDDVTAGTAITTTQCDLTSLVFTSGALSSGTHQCNGAIYDIIYIVTDECGATASCVQQFTLDVGAPTIVCPADATVSCYSDVVVGVPVATTECDLGSTITSVGPTLISGVDFCDEAMYEIVYTVTDACGEVATCTQVYTLDIAPPTIICPADETVSCFADVVPGMATSTAQCGFGSLISSTAPILLSGIDQCDGAIYEITYTVTDDCGTTAQCVQEFTLSIAPPTIVCPADETVSCFDDIAEGTPTVTTECGFGSNVVTVGPTLISGEIGCDVAVYEILYTVTDDCGATASCVQTFTLDVGPPMIVCPPDETVACFDDIMAGVPVITTECGIGSSYVTNGPFLLSGIDLCDGAVYGIMYVVTDDCGSTAECAAQTFTLAVEEPTIVCPADETVSCFEDIMPGVPTTTTGCSFGSTVTSSSPVLVSGTDLCTGAVYEITFNVSDDCGASVDCVQAFTLDVGPPTIVCPADETVSCFTDITPSAAVTTTECGLGSVVTNSLPVLATGTDECDGATYEMTYTVTDDCGSTAQCVQTFTLDVAGPTIICPPDETVACFDDVTAGTPITTTQCGLESIVFTSGSLVSGTHQCDGAVYGITYIITDDCGAFASCTQLFTLDVDPPSIVCPADETVNCFDDIVIGTPVVTTACELGSLISTVGPTLVSGSDLCDDALYEVTYTVTDDCGTTAQCVQVFTLDVGPPVITCPADETVSCFDEIVIGVPIVLTNCGSGNNITTAGPTLISGAGGCELAIYEITYTAVDDCGQSAMCVQTITLDVAAPTIICPPDETVACFDDIMAGIPVISTECGLGSTYVTAGPVLTSGIDLCDGAIYEIMYIVTDDCGSTAECTAQTFTLDIEEPTIVCPADETVSCFADIMAGVPMTTTGCNFGSSVTMTGPTLVSGTALCDGAIYEINFTVSDDCGASVDCAQTFTLDFGPPTIICPADETVTCFSDIAETTPVTTTECGLGSTVTTVGPTLISGADQCDGSIYEIVYTVTDDCGITDQCTQLFTLTVGPPTIVCPADETVSCFDDITETTPITTTECGLGSVISTVGPILISGADLCDEAIYEITYTVTDDCGVTAECVQLFTLDVGPPTIVCPADETVTCFADIAEGTPVITTECGLNGEVSIVGPTLVNGTALCDGAVYDIVYTITDDCGVTEDCRQLFVLSIPAPSITCPADETVTCFTDIVAGTPITSTECGFGSTISTTGPTLVSGSDLCDNAVYEIVYAITDDCGVTSECTQTFTLTVGPPTIVCPADQTVNCFDDIVAGPSPITTECGLGSVITTVGPTLTSGTDMCNGATYDLTYVVTDDCGVTAQCTQSWTLVVGGPTIVCPADETVACFDDILAGTPITIVECSFGSSIQVQGPTLISGTDLCNGAVYEITYTITDDCALTAQCAQTFTLSTPLPTIVCPADETVSCFADIAEGTPSFTAGCGFGSAVTTVGPTLVSGTDLCDAAVYEIEYTVTDDCGTSAQCIQTFTLSVAPPTISCPADQTVNCLADIIPTTATFTVSCGLGGIVTTVGPTLITGNSNCDASVYEIEYIVTDDCGVTASCFQTWTLEVAPPVVTCQIDVTVECFTDIVAVNPMVTTDCGLTTTVTTVGPTLIDGAFGCNGSQYTIEYVVTDVCGAATACMQTFTLSNIEPVINSCPPNATVFCLASVVPQPSDINFTVACGLLSTVDIIGPTLTGPIDVPGTVATFEYVVTDACGRMASCFTEYTLDPPVLGMMTNMVLCSDTPAMGFYLDGYPGSSPIASYNIYSVTADGTVTAMPGSSDLLGSGSFPMNIAFDGLMNESYNNLTSDIVTITYVVTPVSVDGCEGEPVEVTFMILPESVFTNGMNETICSNDNVGVVLMGDAMAGTLGMIQIVSVNSNGLTGINLDPLNVDLMSDAIADDIWTNTTDAPVIVEYEIIPVTDMNCFGDPFMLMITVLPEPVIMPMAFEFCSDTALDIDLTSLVSNGLVGTSFSWFANNNMSLTGEPSGVNFTSFIADVITNDASGMDQIVSYTITPISPEGCLGTPIVLDVTILAEPAGVDGIIEICHNVEFSIFLQDFIDAGNGMTGVSFDYTFVDNPLVSGENTLNSDFLSGPLLNFTNDIQDVVYTIIPESSDGCLGDPFEVTLQVRPEIQIDFPEIGPFCSYDDAVQLTADPTGGIFSGDGVVTEATMPVTYFFDPGLAGGGDHLITYDYIDADGCPGVATINVYVSPPLSVVASSDGLCLGDLGFAQAEIIGGTAPFKTKWLDLGTGTASGYVLSGINTPNLLIITDELTTTVGTIEMQVDITDDIGCTTSDIVTIYVNPIPTITLHPEDALVCPGESISFTFDVLETNVEISWIISQLNGITYEVAGANGKTVVIEDVGDELNGAKIQAKAILLNGGLGPDCPSYSDPACIYIHEGMQMVCNDQINVSLDAFCSLEGLSAGAFLEGETAAIEFYSYTIFDNNDEPIDLDNPSAPNHISNYVGDCLKYEVEDICEGQTCWGTICIQDKLPPVLECECETPYLADGVTPNPDCTLSCFEVADLELLEVPGRNNEILPDPEDSLPEDNCIDFGFPEYVITYDEGQNCGDIIVSRELLWTYTDLNGEVEYLRCTQQFLFESLDINSIGETSNGAWDGYADIGAANVGDRPMSDIYLPESIVQLGCGSDASPEGIAAFFDIDTPGRPAGIDRDDHDQTTTIVEHNEGYPYAYPYVVQAGWAGRFHAVPFNNSQCETYSVYTDQVTEVCNEGCFGNSKIARTWTILDWCTATTILHVQTIKRTDTEGPEISAPDVTISVDPWACTADYKVADPEHFSDECDKDAVWTVNPPLGISYINGTLVGLPKGVSQFDYEASDCCGNVSNYTVNVTVVDETAPTAIALENLVVQLVNDQDGDGTAKLFAVDVDNGSHDGCTDVHFEIRRDDFNSEWCFPGNSSFNNDGHPDDHIIDNDGGEYVKFCCQDLTDIDEDGTPYGMFDVILRVWDDGDGNGNFGSEGDNYNEIWTTVRVEDKQPSVVVCPTHIELSCNEDYLDFNLTGFPTGFNTCESVDCDLDPSDNFRRKPANSPPFVGEEIAAYNPSCRRGAIQRTWSCQGKTCTQWIIMRDTEDGELEITWPEDITADCLDFEVGEPDIVERLCELTGTSLESDTFLFEEGACFKVLNHWTVINWCDYDADDTDLNELTDAEDDGVVPGLYTHTQEIKLIDTEKPILTVQDSCYAVNADCVGEGITIFGSALDNGACSSDWLKWTVEIDLDTDWVIDYEYSSYIDPTDPFYISPSSGDISIDLPDGIAGSCNRRHRVRWSVSDGCGNDTQATSFFTVEDKKAPVPYMLNLGSALMEDGSVELWAIDFNVDSYDNCSDQEYLLYTFSATTPPQLIDPTIEDPWYDADGVASQNDYNSGDAEAWDGDTGSSAMVFTEEDLEEAEANGGLLNLPVYVWDLCGNSDFAIVALSLVDNDGDASANISGRVATEAGIGVEGVTMSVISDQVGYPATTVTSTNGEYTFGLNPMYNDYSLEGEKNDDWLNGVTTLDLVLIQQHILGITDLDSPYKLIAADATNDARVSSLDLIHLRKLILGIYSELPNNDSWRFTDANASMDPSNPWPFSEFVNVLDLQDDMAEDFVGVKIGDVNGSINQDLQDGQTETRNAGALNIQVDAVELEDGLTELIFTSPNFEKIAGLQLNLEAGISEIVNLESGALLFNDQHIALHDESISISWNTDKLLTVANEKLFSMVVKRADSEIYITNDLMVAEAYQGPSLKVIAVKQTSQVALNELYQNEPNPWYNQTAIRFSLADKGSIKLSLYDVNGQLVLTRTGDFERGMNEIIIDKDELNQTSGLIYYKIENDEFYKSGTMIHLK